jgi:hypothetical protein
MKKLVRRTYPTEVSVGLLSILFVVSGFLSHEIFDIVFHDMYKWKSAYLGMILIGAAVVIMVLIIWEEILFPVKTVEVKGGLVFRNHRKKLKIQVLIYCAIPAIFTYIYFAFDVNLLHYTIWASICMIPPIVEKLVSGIHNFNDFLRLTNKEIEYKNNEKEGCFETKDLEGITIIKDDRNFLKKLHLFFKNNDNVIIDLDEMELDAFYGSIYKFIINHYTDMVNERIER